MFWAKEKFVEKFKYSAETAEEAVALFRSQMEVVAPIILASPVCRDPDDDTDEPSEKSDFHPTNGREGKTATLLLRNLLNFELRVGGFVPRHLNRSTVFLSGKNWR